MVADKDLQELVAYSAANHVLSLYLDTDLAHKSKDAVKLALRQSLRAAAGAPSSDVEAVTRYLDYEYDWQPRGVAIFSAGAVLWKTIPLPMAVPTLAVYTERPFVRVLADVIDRFGRYAVALVDKESVRLFSVVGGEIESATEAFGEELKHHRQGGWAAARYQRHQDNLALHNLKQAVEVIEDFCQTSGNNRLMLAGSEEMLRLLPEMLPQPLRRTVIGEFVVDMQASPSEVLRLSLDVVAAVDLEAEQQLVDETVTAASKGGAGVIGLGDALYALREGRVRQLLVEETFHAAGHACSSCGYTTVESSGTCPFCGNHVMLDVPDAVNRAVMQALEGGATVNVVRHNETLLAAGGIAAVLRY